jgi:hypothetical protein
MNNRSRIVEVLFAPLPNSVAYLIVAVWMLIILSAACAGVF